MRYAYCALTGLDRFTAGSLTLQLGLTQEAQAARLTRQYRSADKHRPPDNLSGLKSTVRSHRFL